MGAPKVFARPQGSGSVTKSGSRYGAFAPHMKGEPKRAIGWFDSRYEARKALEKWLRERNLVWPVA